MNAGTTPRLGCEFDRFLYASVGEDNNGMPLTVLSALVTDRHYGAGDVRRNGATFWWWKQTSQWV